MIYELIAAAVLIVAAGLSVQGQDAPAAVVTIVLSPIEEPRTLAGPHGCALDPQGSRWQACHLFEHSPDRAVSAVVFLTLPSFVHLVDRRNG